MIISDNLERLVKDVPQVFLLDYSWHLHRNYNSFKWMTAGTNGMGRCTGHIYGVLDTLMNIRSKYPESLIILCQDGVPVERKEMFEGQETSYKEGRSELEFDFYKDIPVITASAFLMPKVVLAYDPIKESDDIMYALSKQIERVSEAKVFIYSGDDDLLQSISERTVVIRKANDIGFDEIDNRYLLCDERMRTKYHGVDSYHLPFYRCIVGDKSDKMPGIPRFPRELAADLAMRTNSIDNLFEVAKSYPICKESEKKYIILLAENEDRVRLNYSMMKLSADINVPLSRKKPNTDKVMNVLNTYQLRKYISYIRRLS